MHRLNVPLMIYAIDVPFDWSANSEIQYTNTSTKMRQMTQAIAMINVHGATVQHQIYISNPPIVLSDVHCNLEWRIPVIHNQIRRGVLTFLIPLTLNPIKALAKLQQDIAVEIENKFPITVNQSRKIGMMTGKTEIIPLMELKNITKTRLILIKDSQSGSLSPFSSFIVVMPARSGNDSWCQ